MNFRHPLNNSHTVIGIDISPMPVGHGQTPARRLHLPESELPWQASHGYDARDWRSGVSAERRHLKKTDKFAAVCRRAATKQENRSPSP